MIVVLPICSKDYALMLANLDWQRELDGIKKFKCVLSVDSETPRNAVAECVKKAELTFESARSILYDPPPTSGWPQAPNWAFQRTAISMQFMGEAWFWMEPDCIPLRSGWLNRWDEEYRKCKKPMMGYIIEEMGHCNGTAVYPANFPQLSSKTMQVVDLAFDDVMKNDTIHLTHNANHLMDHVWGIHEGQAFSHKGDAAVFKSWSDVVSWVNLDAVLFHRAKDGSLIQQLRSKKTSIEKIILSHEN